MQIITLYKYTREDGGATVSPIKPDGAYSIMFRLIADEGKVLTDGEANTPCVDVVTIDGWHEVDDTNLEDNNSL